MQYVNLLGGFLHFHVCGTHKFHIRSMSQIYLIADSYYSPETMKILNCKIVLLFKFKKHSTMYFSNVQAEQCIKIKTRQLLILPQPVP